MKLSKHKLPDTVTVDGALFFIHTEHWYWFRFAELIAQSESTFGDFDFMYIDTPPTNRKNGFAALFDFYAEKKPLPRDTGGGEKVLDYVIDSNYIYAAFMQCYGIDLAETPLHWHKVRALLAGISNTRLNDIIGFRSYTGKNAEYRRLKAAWSLPERAELTADTAQSERAAFNALIKD